MNEVVSETDSILKTPKDGSWYLLTGLPTTHYIKWDFMYNQWHVLEQSEESKEGPIVLSQYFATIH